MLLIAHEPGLGALLRMLGGSATAPVSPHAHGHFPSAAMAVLDADVDDWRNLGADRVKLVAFSTPRELIEKRPPGA